MLRHRLCVHSRWTTPNGRHCVTRWIRRELRTALGTMVRCNRPLPTATTTHTNSRPHTLLAVARVAAEVGGAGAGAGEEDVGGGEDADEQAREDAREAAVSGPPGCPPCTTTPTTPAHRPCCQRTSATRHPAHRVPSHLSAGRPAARGAQSPGDGATGGASRALAIRRASRRPRACGGTRRSVGAIVGCG